jgi:D-arginine dehydrogenase
MYIESYGAAPLRRLTAASRRVFDAPDPGFSDYPLLTPRGCLTIASDRQLDRLSELEAEIEATGTAYRRVEADAARALAPVLRPGFVAAAVYEPDSCDIDANGLHTGFLRLARVRGAEFRLNARVEALDRGPGGWRVRLSDGETVEARVVVNAAGAWADQVAGLAGADPLGMTPMRRTALLIDPPADLSISAWPSVIDADEQFYFKPESGRILASPADETPCPPMDVAPEELDIAICIDRLQAACDLPVRRVARSWAGLRTFSPDRVPVFGYDPKIADFFWYVGQGGYGMQIAPAAARLGAALALRREVPADIANRGLTAGEVSPGRFTRG